MLLIHFIPGRQQYGADLLKILNDVQHNFQSTPAVPPPFPGSQAGSLAADTQDRRSQSFLGNSFMTSNNSELMSEGQGRAEEEGGPTPSSHDLDNYDPMQSGANEPVISFLTTSLISHITCYSTRHDRCFKVALLT